MAAPAPRLDWQFQLLDLKPSRPLPSLVPAPLPVEPGEGEQLRKLRAGLDPSIAARVRSGAELLRRSAGNTERPTILPTALDAIDTLLGGGLERGRLVELVARHAAGRFAIVLSSLASATQAGEAAALVDLGDHFDPQLAEAAGVDLRRLLWVRPHTMKEAVMSAEMIAATGFQLVVLDLGLHPLRGRRAPEAAWVRLARTAETHRAALLVSSPYSQTGTACDAVVKGTSLRPHWLGRGRAPRLLAGVDLALTLEKHRRMRPGAQTKVMFQVDESTSRRGDESTSRRGESTREEPVTMRVACLFVPMFPLAARLRSEPELREEAIAVVDGSGNAAHVVAATRRARTKGIRPGMSLAQARAIVPKLIARPRDTECERTAQEALFEVAESFSPRVEDAGEGIVYVDISGMGRHYASEQELARAAMRAAEAVTLPARVGIAASKLAARVAAELPKSPTIVAEGHESEFLAPLPLARLSPALDAASTLRRWGITSIGELAGLPENEVASRLGELGRELHHAARGVDPRPLIPRPLPPDFREGMELEWPLVALEPFLFVANAALDRLTKRMELQGFACTRLELTLALEPDGFYSRAIDLPAPTRDVKTMLTLLRLDLEKNPPGAPVASFTLVAHPDRPRRAQLSLFGPPALSPEKLATTIARLVSLLGEDRVGMAMAVDGHLPERYAVGDYDPPPPPSARLTPRRSRGLLAVRVFRPPVPVEVITSASEREGELRIDEIRGEGDLSGSVRVSSGPWRLESGWWSDAPDAREYWDVELERGGIYRLYQSAPSHDWFVDARYD